MTVQSNEGFSSAIEERIAAYPNELATDAVGLWQIVPYGYDEFDLRGDDLKEFTNRCIMKLLASGAKPVRSNGESEYDWIVDPQYGEANEEIASSVVAAWLEASSGEPRPSRLDEFDNPANPGGLWFALIDGGRYSVDR